LIGLTGEGIQYLDALCSDDRFELVAVGDTDAAGLRHAHESTDVRIYDDLRSLIVESASTGLDLLVVAVEPFRSGEFVRLAADRDCAVLHKAPLARNFREAELLVGRFEERRCPLMVARARLSEPGLDGLEQLGELIGHVYAATAHVETTDTPAGWRGDAARAGGGVLLNGAYEVLDLLVHLLGPVSRVHASCGWATELGAARKHDTEDVAIVSLDLGRGRVASLTAVRGAPERREAVVLYGTSGIIEIDGGRMTVNREDADRPGEVGAQEPSLAARAIAAVGAALTSGGARLSSSGQEHLMTMATIEAAYLSARTGAPESPSRFTAARALA
jgi:predicted dehydrogenase